MRVGVVGVSLGAARDINMRDARYVYEVLITPKLQRIEALVSWPRGCRACQYCSSRPNERTIYLVSMSTTSRS